ncbi:preprotein translocase subunit SecE [Pseudoclavibacter sp. 13-3]|uniref:preprotein translocase subunit SecE n=1 Tax=Pseudoclavibacter sp. 13-3 TaxID=2901228 RepID=UPI001E2FC211|nr:preprotein translocase subunit SecE [Pseudoclavibacter sp. 13-3]MCD7101700.1 preprotein translocase subunit SecE [Pseudoclavibacter sp. 13-3]
MAAASSDELNAHLVDNAETDRAKARGVFGRLFLFFRQVFGELRKVTTPTRKELTNQTLVVLAFVLIMMAIITLLDLVFGMGVGFLFERSA